MKIEVPVAIKVDAGVGTSQVDVHILLVDDTNSLTLEELESVGCELLHSLAVEHAESYGIYLEDDGWVDEDGEETDEAYAYVLGVYDPEEHDMLRCGGGSFLEEELVKEVYEKFKKLVA